MSNSIEDPGTPRKTKYSRVYPTKECNQLLEEDITHLSELGYTIGYKLGEGTFAYVMSAAFRGKRDRNIQLACKVINRAALTRVSLEEFLEREITIITKLRHPSIISTHSVLQHNDTVFIFMRYAEKGNLLAFLDEHEKLPERSAKEWFYQIAKGIQYLQKQNYAHRDIKLENILITQHMNLKLVDFGFATLCSPTQLSDTYCGSTAFAAPEVIKPEPYNPLMADIYSVGVVLFCMVNGRTPFIDLSIRKQYRAQMAKTYCYEVNTFSQDLKSLIDGMLEPIVSDRWRIEKILESQWFVEDKAFFGKYYTYSHASPQDLEKNERNLITVMHLKCICDAEHCKDTSTC